MNTSSNGRLLRVNAADASPHNAIDAADHECRRARRGMRERLVQQARRGAQPGEADARRDAREQQPALPAGRRRHQLQRAVLVVAQAAAREHVEQQHPAAQHRERHRMARAEQLHGPQWQPRGPPPQRAHAQHDEDLRGHQHAGRRALQRPQQRAQPAQRARRALVAGRRRRRDARGGPVEQRHGQQHADDRRREPQHAAPQHGGAHFPRRPGEACERRRGAAATDAEAFQPRLLRQLARDLVLDGPLHHAHGRQVAGPRLLDRRHRARATLSCWMPAGPVVSRPTHTKKNTTLPAVRRSTRDHVEPDRQRGAEGQRRQRDEQAGLDQFPQVDVAILGAHELRDQADDQRRAQQSAHHREMARPLRQQVRAAPHRGGAEQLPDARLEVALHRAAHQVEADQAPQQRHHRQHHADPGARVEAAMVVADRDDHVARVRAAAGTTSRRP